MAENIDLSPLQEALNQFARSTEQSVATQMGYYRDSDGILKKLQKTEKSRLELEDKINKELVATYGQRKVVGDKQKELYKQQLANLGYIVDSTGKIAKAVGSVDLSRAQQRQIARLEELDRKQKALIEAQINFTRNLKDGAADIGKSLGGFAAELASGNTSFTALNPIIDAVANTMSSLASAIPLLGGVISGTVKAAAEGAKIVLQLAEKNLKTFQDLSSVGATVVDGMSGVNRQFLASGMSLEGFTKTIKGNAETLSRYGGTVGMGAERFTKAVGLLTKPGDGPLAKAGMELRKLGLTADDIGERAAAYLEQEMLLGRGRNMTSDQLAKGTVAYTKELTALQKVTGMQREDIEKERKKLMGESRFSAIYSELDSAGFKAGADKIRDIITAMPQEMQEGMKELSAGKGLLGPASAQLAATLGSDVQFLFDGLRKAATPEEAAKEADILIKNLQKMAKGAQETFEGVSIINPNTFLNFAKLLELSNKPLGSFKDAMTKTEAEANNQDALTKSAIQAQQNMEKLSQEMWRLGNVAMPLVMKATAKFTSVLIDAINKIKDILGIGDTAPPVASGQFATTGGGAATGNTTLSRATTLGNTNIRPGSLRERAALANAARAAAAQPAASSQPAAASAADDPLAGLRFRDRNENTGGGNASPKLIELAKEVQDMFPQATFTALNDVYHQTYHPNSAHTKGRALDVVFGPHAPRNATEAADMKKLFMSMGFSSVKDEYFADKNQYTTGPHFHAEVSAKYGGIASGPMSGFPAMLHGPKEAIVPLATDSILEKLAQTPASNLSANSLSSSIDESRILMMLSDKFDQMIDKLSAGVNIQDQILKYSRT